MHRSKRGGTVQSVQDLIRDAIVKLELKPGVFIDKNALCERLGLSRFPVSEALGRLADEGLVEVIPQHGTRVTQIDLAHCREAMFIRCSLESNALRELAPRISAKFIEELERNMDHQRDAITKDDRIRFHQCDLELHELLLAELGYDRVKASVSAARAQLDRLRLFMCTPRRQASTFAEHRRIVDALASRDPENASLAMEDHLNTVMNELSDFVSNHPDVFANREQVIAAAE